MITLEDLAELKTQEEIKEHLRDNYNATEEQLEGYEFLIAYESTGSWGCDSSSYFLMKKDGELYEVHGGHCSCYGFEDQFEPEKTDVAYLKSDKFYFSTGGYDEDREANQHAVKEYIKSSL